MPTNLVASLSKSLTPELLSRITSGLGLDRVAVDKAATATVPAILAALVSLVAKPGGVAKLGDALERQSPGILSNIASAIGAPGQKDLVNTGLGALSALLGGRTVSTLTNAVSQYAGLGEGGSKGLLGLLGPLLLGGLGQQQRASGLDAAGLAKLVESQKDNIARALPAGFAKYLSGSGILDQITGPAAKAETGAEREQSSSMLSWALPVLGVLVLGALAWNLLGRNPTETTTSEAPQSTMQSSAGSNFIVAADEAKNWAGRAVYSGDNKKIGEIVELTRGPDNKVTEVDIDTGTFLGMGATRYRVTSDQIQEVKPDGLVLTVKEAEVKSLPEAGPK